MTNWNGIHRATVVNNVDPNNTGFIKVTLDSIPNDQQRDAAPCVPYAGPGVGFAMIPEVGSKVWVAFEDGVEGNPVWIGAFWDGANLPAPADANPAIRVLRTNFGALIFDEAAQTLTIEIPGNKFKIVATPGGAEISGEPSLKMSGPGGNTYLLLSGSAEIRGWPLGFETPTDATLARISELEAKVAALEAQVNGGS